MTFDCIPLESSRPLLYVLKPLFPNGCLPLLPTALEYSQFAPSPASHLCSDTIVILPSCACQKPRVPSLSLLYSMAHGLPRLLKSAYILKNLLLFIFIGPTLVQVTVIFLPIFSEQEVGRYGL